MDTSEQSAGDKETSSIKVGTGGNVKRSFKLPVKLRRPRINIKTFLYLLFAVIILAALWTGAKKQFHIGEKVYAQAAGHKIYKEDVEKLIGNTKGVSAHKAAAVLADKYLTEKMAKDAKLTVTDKDITDQYPGLKKNGKNEFLYQQTVNNAYFDKLSAYNAGLYKGKLIVANFSRHIAFDSPVLDLQRISDPLIGNAAAVAADKKYASNFINGIYGKIKSGKISFDQAIKMERDDPQLGLKAYGALPHSGAFDTSNIYLGSTALIQPISIQPKISKMKQGELSRPFAVSVANSLKDNGDSVESYYLIVRMDYSLSSHSGLSFDKYMTQAKSRLGYKVYV